MIAEVNCLLFVFGFGSFAAKTAVIQPRSANDHIAEIELERPLISANGNCRHRATLVQMSALT